MFVFKSNDHEKASQSTTLYMLHSRTTTRSNRHVPSRMVRLIFSITHCFSFTQNRLMFYACIDYKTLKLLFKSSHEFFWHNKTFFCSSKTFKTFTIIPYLSPHVREHSFFKRWWVGGGPKKSRETFVRKKSAPFHWASNIGWLIDWLIWLIYLLLKIFHSNTK